MKITAGMRKITPSGYGEEAYRAAHPVRRYADFTGPAGILIPDQRTTFRATSDPKVLSQIALAAVADFRAAVLPQSYRDATAEALASVLRAKYPPADMEVLRRYGLASVRGRLFIEMGRYGAQRLELPDPVLLPNGAATFRTSTIGSGDIVPDGQMAFFDDLAAAIDAERDDFMNVRHWPGQFKVREGRWPVWGQLEAMWPRISAWMAAQRGGA